MDPENRGPPHSHHHSPMGSEHRGPPPPTPPPKHTFAPPPPQTPPKHHLPEEHYAHKYPEEDYNKHGHSDHGGGGRDPRSTICGVITVLLLLAGATALTVYLVYRPQHPKFTVLGVAVFNLNNTSPPYIATTMQFSLVTRNPNKRVSIYFDHLSAFVTYHDQMITQPVALPPFYHHKHSTVQLAPILGGGDGGGAVAVSSDASYGLLLDEAYGVVGLRLVLVGKLRWKAGGIVTRRYGVYVKCDVLVRLNKGFVGQVPLVAPPKCDFDA